jgi:hypothetical protein
MGSCPIFFVIRLKISYLCNELQNERHFCTRHDNWTTRVNEWSNMSCAKNSHFATSFIQDFF